MTLIDFSLLYFYVTKKLVSIFAITLMGCFVFSSCQKDINSSISRKGVPATEKGIPTEMLKDSSRILTNEQIDSIAMFHNAYMIEAIQNFDFSVVNDSIELRSLFINIGLNDFDYSSSELSSMLDSSGDRNGNLFFIETYTSSNVTTIIDSCQDFLNQNANITYDDVVTFVSLMKSASNSSLLGSDLDASLTFLETFQNAVYLWMPAESGGSGIGQEFLSNLLINLNQNSSSYIPNAAHQRKINWKKIAFADGAGAVGVLLRTWYLADFGPLSWGAILGAIGFGAAWASGSAILIALTK